MWSTFGYTGAEAFMYKQNAVGHHTTQSWGAVKEEEGKGEGGGSGSCPSVYLARFVGGTPPSRERSMARGHHAAAAAAAAETAANARAGGAGEVTEEKRVHKRKTNTKELS